jgi:hypothetical protein
LREVHEELLEAHDKRAKRMRSNLEVSWPAR